MNTGRITDIHDVCPKCEHHNGTFTDKCAKCGYRIGMDWATVEVDLETGEIVRTIAQPAPVATGESEVRE